MLYFSSRLKSCCNANRSATHYRTFRNMYTIQLMWKFSKVKLSSEEPTSWQWTYKLTKSKRQISLNNLLVDGSFGYSLSSSHPASNYSLIYLTPLPPCFFISFFFLLIDLPYGFSFVCLLYEDACKVFIQICCSFILYVIIPSCSTVFGLFSNSKNVLTNWPKCLVGIWCENYETMKLWKHGSSWNVFIHWVH